MKNNLALTLFLFLVLALLAAQTPSFAIQTQNRKARAQQSTDDSQASPEARAKLRRLAQQKKTYQVGYSPVMDRKEAQLAGVEIPNWIVALAAVVIILVLYRSMR